MKIFKVISLGALLALPLGVGCGSSGGGSKADGGGGHGATGGNGGTGGGGTAGGGGGAGGGGAIGTDGGAGVGGAIGSDGGDGSVPLIEFTDFVNDLIINKTSSTTQPETINDKVFKDSMNPAAFDPLFK